MAIASSSFFFFECVKISDLRIPAFSEKTEYFYKKLAIFRLLSNMVGENIWKSF